MTRIHNNKEESSRRTDNVVGSYANNRTGGAFKMNNIKRTTRRGAILLAVALSSLSMALVCCGASVPAGVEMPSKLPQLKGPVVITSIGQAPGGMQVAILLKRAGIANTRIESLTAQDLADAAKNPAKAFNTLILSMGTSGKGMGAAGINVNTEVARCNALAAQAKKLGIFVVGVQIEGSSRRTDEADEKSNAVVSKHSDLLIVRTEVDSDGFFTNASKRAGIPLVRAKDALSFEHIFRTLFGVEAK